MVDGTRLLTEQRKLTVGSNPTGRTKTFKGVPMRIEHQKNVVVLQIMRARKFGVHPRSYCFYARPESVQIKSKTRQFQKYPKCNTVYDYENWNVEIPDIFTNRMHHRNTGFRSLDEIEEYVARFEDQLLLQPSW